jgi:hypothetical protein
MWASKSTARSSPVRACPAGSGCAQRPTRGLSKAEVEARFGTPSETVAAIGDPPISRWEYPGFVVYFEYELVIHAVPRR